jgi:hypothetical protein
MRPLGITSILALVAGVIIVAAAQSSVQGIIDDTNVLATPDLTGPTIWSWIGGALIGVAVTTFVLELLMVEIRQAIRMNGALGVERVPETTADK